MTRIFTSLAVTAMVLLFANMFVGLIGGDYNEISNRLRQRRADIEDARRAIHRDRDLIEQQEAAFDQAVAEFEPMARHMTLHRLLGVLASLVTVFVNSVGVTYFIGTGRWVREVIEAYGFDQTHLQHSARLKRFTFLWALTGMLTVVAMVASGAAADPGTLRETTERWVMPHLVAAMGGIALIALCLVQQYRHIVANQEIIGELVRQVARVREERGLKEVVEV